MAPATDSLALVALFAFGNQPVGAHAAGVHQSGFPRAANGRVEIRVAAGSVRARWLVGATVRNAATADGAIAFASAAIREIRSVGHAGIAVWYLTIGGGGREGGAARLRPLPPAGAFTVASSASGSGSAGSCRFGRDAPGDTRWSGQRVSQPER